MNTSSLPQSSADNVVDFNSYRHRTSTGPDARPEKKSKRSYLLKRDYRSFSLESLNRLTDQELTAYFERLRWGPRGHVTPICSKCGSINSHYRCPSIGGWKCKDCGKQFSVFSGTRVHGMKMSARKLLSIAFHFVEAKDGISSRELSGQHDLDHQTTHVLTLKIREALRETMTAEPPLNGYIQADAAYFIKYIRPSNQGLGPAMAAKREQRSAGLEENQKPSARVNPDMHALAVFVQMGPQKRRRYRVAMIKTETQVDILTLAQTFCTKESALLTDQHSAYNVFSGDFVEHYRVNHSREFVTKEGFNTNLAEGIFSRIRAAVQGAWHRMSVQNLVEYGWELAWRQEMVGHDNKHQLDDLLRRILTSGRANRFIDYWEKRPVGSRPLKEEVGVLHEVDKENIKKKRGRPSSGTVRPKVAQPGATASEAKQSAGFSPSDGTSSSRA
jgi:transposase-like protein